MKTLLINATYKNKIKLNISSIKKLPNKVGLITTVQFVNQLKDIKVKLEKAGKECFIKKFKQPFCGQVLGCESSSAKIKEAEAILFVGTGKFHPINVALETKKPVFVLNPMTGLINELDKTEINRIENKKRTALLKYHSANNIGILVSTKLGQEDFNSALKLKTKLEKQKKNAFIFIENNINFQALEDFSFIQAWVNTACPRIIEDFTCINLSEIK